MTTNCVVELCESFDGDRFIQLRPSETVPSDPFYMTETVAVLGSKLIAWEFRDLDKHLMLVNGDRFWFTEDGRWDTTNVYERLIDIPTPEWTGDLIGLIDKDSAIHIATEHCRSIGYQQNCILDGAELMSQSGKPVWFIFLSFEEDSKIDTTFENTGKLVYVDARTGIAESCPSL